MKKASKLEGKKKRKPRQWYLIISTNFWKILRLSKEVSKNSFQKLGLKFLSSEKTAALKHSFSLLDGYIEKWYTFNSLDLWKWGLLCTEAQRRTAAGVSWLLKLTGHSWSS